MNTDKKVELIINILPLVPFIAQGIAEAADTFNRVTADLKDGTLSEDETQAMLAERDAVIERIIAKTA